MTLYLKLHTNQLAWYLDDTHYGIIYIYTSQLNSGEVLHKHLSDIVNIDVKVDRIVLEKPNLKLIGDSYQRLAKMIIHTQRHFGMLIWLLHSIFEDVPQEHLNIKKVKEVVYNYSLNKDVQLSEARALLNNSDELTPLSLLCLHDCLVMYRYMKDFKQRRYNGQSN